MSDRFSIHPNCSVCGTDLDDNEYGMMLMMPVGEFIDLACPKCGIMWRFWLEVSTQQKKIGQKKVNKKEKL